jgi:hypothetical protein
MTDGLPSASADSVAHWVQMASRLDLLGLREFEAQLGRHWSADSLGPAIEAFAKRREELSRATDYPTCAYCGGPCNKPFGWFVVERWEGGEVARRGYVCGAGCLIATAHAQRDRSGDSEPIEHGRLEPVEEKAVARFVDQHPRTIATPR